MIHRGVRRWLATAPEEIGMLNRMRYVQGEIASAGKH
jgi:hypothetical protein